MTTLSVNQNKDNKTFFYFSMAFLLSKFLRKKHTQLCFIALVT